MKNLLRVTAITGSVAALAALTGPATANHAWSTYHWDTGTTNTVSVTVGDNVSNVWDGYLNTAISDWNASPNIDVSKVAGTVNSDCPIQSGRIEVCNDSYGTNGWLGIASIALSGGHIAGGVTKLNDTYFNTSQYNTPSWRQLVTCQEIGHDFGLGHQNENFNTDLTESCMEYTSLPAGNEGPDQHDMDMLAQIYGHTHGGDTGGGGKPPKGDKPCRGKKCGLGKSGAAPGDWGRAVGYDRSGRANVYMRRVNGMTIITHVTWAIGYQPDDHHG